MTNTYQKEWQKKRRERLKQEGLCSSCGKFPPAENKASCVGCLEKHRFTMRKWKQKEIATNKAKGLCNCGGQVVEGKKICQACADKGLRRYYSNKQKGRCSYCKNTAIPGMTRCSECSNKHRIAKQQLRQEVFAAYGGSKCNCCGETIDKFLTLDHIHNDGNKHRKQVGRTSVYRWLKQNNYPPGFQVLCWNCNLGRQHNGGICPHRQT